VVNMANRANVHMRLGTIKLLLGHASPSSSSVCRTHLFGAAPDVLNLKSDRGCRRDRGGGMPPCQSGSGGEGRIRTYVRYAGRFTVCCL
jgi:hypothetical protein